MSPEERATQVMQVFLDSGLLDGFTTAVPATLIAQAIRRAENEAIERAFAACDEIAKELVKEHEPEDEKVALYAALGAIAYAGDRIRSLATKDP